HCGVMPAPRPAADTAQPVDSPVPAQNGAPVRRRSLPPAPHSPPLSAPPATDGAALSVHRRAVHTPLVDTARGGSGTRPSETHQATLPPPLPRSPAPAGRVAHTPFRLLPALAFWLSPPQLP